MNDFVIALIIASIVLTIVLSAFFSGSEMALSAANRVRLESQSDDGDKRAKRALKLIETFDRTLSAILVGNNLVNIAASSLTTVFVILVTGTDRLNWLASIVLTVIVILFGETVPKIISKRNATKISKSVSGPVSFFRVLFSPLCVPVSWITGLLTKRIEEHDQEESEEEKAAELQQIIDTAESEGVIDEDQSELVSAAIDFSEISADEAMTSRVDMEAIDLNADRDELIDLVYGSTHSRLPVYDGSIDHVIGVVHMNHLLKALSDDRNARIEELMMEPLYVYRTTKLPQVLNLLKKERQHLAIVVDEYSGTLGVITMEDVLEEIVGDIWDETDEVEEEVVERNDGEYEIDGDMHTEDFFEFMGVQEDRQEYESETVGGLVIERNGDFPKEGDVVRLTDSIEATVLRMDGLRVEKLLVRAPKSDDGTETGEAAEEDEKEE